MPIRRADSSLAAGERLLVAELDPQLTLEPDGGGVGVFLRAGSRRSASRLSFSAGALPGLPRYVYQDVSSADVRAGLTSLRDAGLRPRFVILDDGWQSVESQPTGERRLVSLVPTTGSAAISPG